MNSKHWMMLWLTLATLASHPLWAAPLETDGQRTLLFGHDDRHPVATNDTPWSAVAQIETAEQNLCSGILIAPQWVVSSGHCFISANRHQQAALSVRFAGKPGTFWQPDRVLLPQELATGLTADGDSFIISPDGSRHDIALLHLATAVQGVTPIPLWTGDQQSLATALNQQGNLVSQGGYPQDSLDTLLVHSRCQIRKLSEQGILEHRCDTLPGDSGSPLLLPTPQGWRVVGIQSSAPEPSDRWQADNLAIAIPTISSLLNHWMS